MPDFFREWLLSGGAQSANTDRNGSGTNRPLRSIISAVPDHILCESADGRVAPQIAHSDWSVSFPRPAEVFRMTRSDGIDAISLVKLP